MNLDGTLSQWPEFLKLLAHDIRWSILSLLAHSDYRGRELVQKLRQPQNLISYHVRLLAEAQLVTERRSSADARDVYYSLNIDMLGRQYFTALGMLHPALDASQWMKQEKEHTPERVPSLRVLFLCTKNSARSQMAEGLLRHASNGSVDVSSAGTEPTSIHPLAIQTMERMQIDIQRQQTRHVRDFEGQLFHYVITVCDRARETCPTFPGTTEQIHWSVPDPASTGLSEQESHTMFEHVGNELRNRVRYFLARIEHEDSRALSL